MRRRKPNVIDNLVNQAGAEVKRTLLEKGEQVVWPNISAAITSQDPKADYDGTRIAGTVIYDGVQRTHNKKPMLVLLPMGLYRACNVHVGDRSAQNNRTAIDVQRECSPIEYLDHGDTAYERLEKCEPREEN